VHLLWHPEEASSQRITRPHGFWMHRPRARRDQDHPCRTDGRGPRRPRGKTQRSKGSFSRPQSGQKMPVTSTRRRPLLQVQLRCRTTHIKNLCPFGSSVAGFSTPCTLLTCSRKTPSAFLAPAPYPSAGGAFAHEAQRVYGCPVHPRVIVSS
jgi:hypothetical protein